MTIFDTTDLEVCEVCIHLLANGEYNDGTDAAERAYEGMAKVWGDDARYLIANGDDLGYSTSVCDGCGDSHHGDRFAAVALIPVVTTYRFDGFTDIPHTLTLLQAGHDAEGRQRWRYRLNAGTETVFTGDDLRSPVGDCSADSAARAALGFLTLRPGDTDAEYFDDYTPAQEAWRDTHAENLSIVLYTEDGAERADLGDYRRTEPSSACEECAGSGRVDYCTV